MIGAAGKVEKKMTHSTPSQGHCPLDLTIYPSETPRPNRTLLTLVILFIQVILLKQILIAHIQERLELAHHPRKRDIRKLHIIITTAYICVRTRKPNLA